MYNVGPHPSVVRLNHRGGAMKLREFLDTTSGQNFLGSRRNCYFTERVLDINNIRRLIVPVVTTAIDQIAVTETPETEEL